MPPAPVTLTNARQIGSFGGSAPRVAADCDFDPLLRRTHSHAVHRSGKEIIRNELIKTFHLLVRHVEEHYPILQFGTRAKQFDGLQMPGVEFFECFSDVRKRGDFLKRSGKELRNQSNTE